MKLLLFSSVAALSDVDRLGIIGDYHIKSSHSVDGYCPMPEAYDWASMPGPRIFDSERHALPLARLAVDAAPADSVSALLLACCGLSGVKDSEGNRWYVRSNPSSGNLHPVETYVLLKSRLYHYDALSHSLEQRAANATAPVAVSEDAVVVLLSAISWREEWKYGLRGPRYTYLDAGHAIGAVLQAARAFGWIGYVADHLADADLAALLGINDSLEAPVAAIVLDRCDGVAVAPDPTGDVTWYGAARPLAARSWSHPAADALASAVSKPATPPRRPYIADPPPSTSAEAYVRLARRRRTALAFARNTTTRAAFFEILNAILDEARRFEGVQASPLLVFVHGVDDIEPGTYLVNPGELLSRVPAVPVSWPQDAHLISNGDVREATAAAACHQAIAGDAAFVVAFVADMGAAFSEPPSPYMYPRLFWQAGALGQRLYLAATARGLGVSGIGCFFDDAVHAFLGLEDQRFQALYLVAVGAALPDARLLAEDPFVGLRGEGVSFTV
jgi:SagB-type dehydrogenase family enzyme